MKRRQKEPPRTLVDETIAEAEALYETLVAKAATRRFPLEPLFGAPKLSVLELAPLAYFLGRNLADDLRAAEAKARRAA